MGFLSRFNDAAAYKHGSSGAALGREVRMLQRTREADEQGYTGVHRGTRVYTGVHGFTQEYTGVHRGTRGYTGVHRGTQGYTGVHRSTQGYTEVHRGTQAVRAGTLNPYLSATLKECLRARGAPIGYGHFPKN